ncbi:MAG: ATP-binding cassette domain-containing protein [Streptosporangiales bacterium]|nr:ATP-binding cassette domain-containing protein [Streptosporangiales bacterium]
MNADGARQDERFDAAGINAQGIHLSFGRNHVLRGVDLEVGRAQTACLIGPSGSGKSTFLRTVNRLLEPDAAHEEALRQLDLVGLRAKADSRPGHLSGGQQQRAAIARALAMGPQAMLFDEVTSALDPELVKGVLSLMADLSREGMTMIVVTHEMGFAREAADTVVFLDRGVAVETGPPTQIFGDPQSPRLQQFLADVL